MKKVLLATTALGVFAAGSAFAENPTVSVGGKITTQVGIADQNTKFSNANSSTTVRLRDTEDSHIRTDSRVDVKVSGKADNGLGYGGVTTIIGNASGKDDDGNESTAGEKAYIYVDSGLGKVEAGSNSGASQSMKVSAASFARGSGGIAGDFYKFVNLGASATNSSGALGEKKFIVTPDLPSVALPGARTAEFSSATVAATAERVTEYANKVTYYSPRLMGLQAGVSYAPNLGEKGNSNGFKGKYAGASAPQYARDVWTGGVNYQGEYNQVGIKASAVAENGGKTQKTATTDTTTHDDIKAYELGLNLNYAGAVIGGSWATIPEFGRDKTQNDEAGFWTLGAGYEFGPFAASVTYLNSKAEDDSAGTSHKNTFKNVSVGADYKLAPGLVPYVEVSFFDTNDKVSTTTDNDGSVVIVGTQLTF